MAQSDPGGADGGARRQSTWVRDAIEVVAIAVVLYLVIWTCIQTVKVDGHSMDHTLADKDLLIASKISYRFGNPERGDIIILVPPPYCSETPNSPLCNGQPSGGIPQNTDFIKRVIGLPGDSVEIDGNKHPTALYIQPGGSGPWARVAEPYLPETWTVNTFCCNQNGTSQELAQPQVLHIPDGMYFVLGDNRNASSDSRYFGLVPRDKILAKAILRIWPIGTFGGLGAGPTLVTVPGITLVLPLGLVRIRRRVRRALAASPRDGPAAA